MAEALKRMYDMIVLKLELEPGGAETAVRCMLQSFRDGVLVEEQEGRVPAAEFGIPRHLGGRDVQHRGPGFRLPDGLADAARGFLDRSASPDGPLWVHLRRPYGYLGLVPFAQLLVPELGVPVLRLPEFIVRPPTGTRRSLHIALCGSAPTAKDPCGESHDVLAERLDRICDALTSASPRSTRVHVFCDREAAPLLHQRVASRGAAAGGVVIHDPEGASGYAAPRRDARIDEGARVENPWLRWMLDALRGTRVDAVHFLANGWFARDRGALALAESPVENEDRRMARFVGVEQVAAFLGRVGAWTAACSSPPHNASEPGLRLFADALADRWAGDVVHHEMRLDEGLDALRGAASFLFAVEPGFPPTAASLTMSCQPFRVAQPAASRPERRAASEPAFAYADADTDADGAGGEATCGGAMPEALEQAAIEPEAADAYVPAAEPPPWMQSAQRLVEQAAWDVSAESRRAEGSESRVRQSAVQAMEQTLADIQAALRRARGEGPR